MIIRQTDRRPAPSAAPVRPSAGERGTGTVLAVGVMAVVLALFVVGATAGRYLVAGHHARAAADLAALAGAVSYRSAPGTPAETACAASARSARTNGARLVHCDVVGDVTDFVVSVRTEVEVGDGLPGLPTAMPGRAFAGPAGPGSAGSGSAGSGSAGSGSAGLGSVGSGGRAATDASEAVTSGGVG